MDSYQFLISISWVIIVAVGLGIAAYLILSGRLRWFEYQSGVGKMTVKITSDLNIKGLSPDEMIAFESFVCRDLSHLERGARLIYILLFIERELIEARFVDNTLELELTKKGKEVHQTLIQESEKKLMIQPTTDVKWKSGEKEKVKKIEKDTLLHK